MTTTTTMVRNTLGRGLVALGLWLGVATASQATETVVYYHTDALGSPVAVTDAGGAVIERRTYEPYGKQLTPTPKDGPGYTGHVYDAATGLDYMQQRYYDPAIGRFLSVDPVTADGNTGSNFNRYWYAMNNPYRFTDPDGRFAKGSGWTPDTWRDFDKAQQAAARSFETSAAEITNAIAAGGDALANAQANFESSFGEGTGTVENMQTMAGNLAQMAAALSTHDKNSGFVANAKSASEMSAYKGFSKDVAMGVPSGTRTVLVNTDHTTFGNFSAMRNNIGHESGHAALGFPDQRVNGVKAIFSGSAAEKSAFLQLNRVDPVRALRNPDTIMRYGR